MRASRQLLVALPIIAAVAACSPSAAASGTASAVTSAPPSAASQAPASASTAPSSPASAAPSSQAPSSAPAASGPTAAPTALDPCQLVTQSEASSLAGMQLGAGRETNDSNRKMCTYGGTGTDVTVFLVQAPSQAALDAGKAEALAALQKAAGSGMKTTIVSGIGDTAALLTLSRSAATGLTLNATAIYVVKGLTFFAITDISVGHATASEAAIKAQAMTTVSRIP